MGFALSQCWWPGQLPSQSRQTGIDGGFCHGARRSVVAMHVRDSPSALGHRGPRQKHCLVALGDGRVGTSERSPI